MSTPIVILIVATVVVALGATLYITFWGIEPYEDEKKYFDELEKDKARRRRQTRQRRRARRGGGR